MSQRRYKTLETNAIHAGNPETPIDNAVVTPIFQTAQYRMAGETTYDAVRYIRLHNSTNHHVLHGRLAALENAEDALVTASGMAAISATILSFVRPGDHLMVHKSLYGGTQTFMDTELKRLGIESTAFDAAAPGDWEQHLRPETKMIYVESISNPLIEVGDLRAVVAFAKANNLMTAIDSTFATPVNFRPLDIGFDLVLHSATKYLNGHSDIVAGCVAGTAENVAKVRHHQNYYGAALDPHACFLFDRGLKTLALRVERQNENALALAQFLEGHDKVRRVCYPGLPSDPGHERAKDLFNGFGGMVSFYTESAEVANAFLDNVQLPIHAPSLGGVESLVVQPARSTHLDMKRAERAALGITDELIRISVGIEHIDELIEDFAQALGD